MRTPNIMARSADLPDLEATVESLRRRLDGLVASELSRPLTDGKVVALIHMTVVLNQPHTRQISAFRRRTGDAGESRPCWRGQTERPTSPGDSK
jgi:hypothetical protein